MNRPPLLQVDDLAVTYPARHDQAATLAVDRVSLQLAAGETLGLAGASGCGKSSLARALLGLAPISAGRILLDGEDVTSQRSKRSRRRLQLMFQDATTALSPRRTIAQTLSEPLRHFGLCTRTEEAGKMRRALQDVELDADCLPRFPHQLSSGQRQRVALARALVAEPDILVAYEPVSALDVSVQARVLRLLNAARQQRGLSLLLVSHDLAVLRSLGDRIAVMDGGRIVESGSARRILSAPEAPATQRLVRAIPCFPGAAGSEGVPLE